MIETVAVGGTSSSSSRNDWKRLRNQFFSPGSLKFMHLLGNQHPLTNCIHMWVENVQNLIERSYSPIASFSSRGMPQWNLVTGGPHVKPDVVSRF